MGGWVAGLIGKIAISAQLELKLGLSLAKVGYENRHIMDKLKNLPVFLGGNGWLHIKTFICESEQYYLRVVNLIPSTSLP